MDIQVTVTGKTPGDVAAKLTVAAQAWSGTGTTTTGKLSGAKRAKAPVEVEDEELSLSGGEETTEETEELSFDSMGDDEETEVEEAPKKKTTKAPKVTEKELNAACMAYAKEHGRPATMKLLKNKFKVGSLTEIKPEQYSAAVAALTV